MIIKNLERAIKFTGNIFFPAFVFFVLSFSFLNAQNENFRFRKIDSESGLSSNAVHAVIQDKQGFIWFGTEDGLNRFDGYSFKIFKNDPSDSNSISNNWIWDLFCDSEGKIWAATNSGGLNLYDPETGKFTRFLRDPKNTNSVSGNNIRVVSEDKKGNIWIGTNYLGLSKFNKKTQKFTRYNFDFQNKNSISSNQISAIYCDSFGNLWIGTYDNGLNLYDEKSDSFIRFTANENDPNSIPNNKILSIYEDEDKFIWIGTAEGALSKLDRKSKSFNVYSDEFVKNHSSIQYEITSIIPLNKNLLWVGTYNLSLLLFDKSKNEFHEVSNNFAASENFGSKNITSILKDNAGNFWFATTDNGIYYFNQSFSEFKLLRQNPADPAHSLSYNTVRSVLEDSKGVLWIGTLGGGLNRLDPKTNEISVYKFDPQNPKSLRNNGVTALLEDSEKNIWAGTWGGGLQKLISREGKNKNFEILVNDENNKNSLRDNVVKSLAEDKFGRIWVGTESGVDLFDKKNKKFYHIPRLSEDPNSISSDLIQSILVDKKGNIWIATWGGLNKFDIEKNPKDFNGKFHFEKFYTDPKNQNSLSDNRIISLYEDENGNIWAGTYGGGLNKISFENGKAKFERFTEKSGLPNNIIFGIAGDDLGRIWVSTNNGVSKFDTESGIFTNFDKGDGLQGNSFYWGAYHKGKSGTIYFGGLNGLTYFDPKEIAKNTNLPEVKLVGFKKFNEDFSFDNPISKMEEIVLPYNDNFITFEFAALDYSNPAKNQYEYKMEGFDRAWIKAENLRRATYTNLDPGEYVFKVRASNNHGVWNNEGTQISLIIKPPFWKTIWFKILLSLFLFTMIYFVYRQKVKNIKARNKELQELNLKLRKEIEINEEIRRDLEIAKEKAIASDNLKSEFLAQISHEIRTPINSLMSYSDLLKTELHGRVNDELEYGIEALHKSGNRILRTMDLIINMSEMQAGTYEVSSKKIDVYLDVLTVVYHDFKSLAKSKNLNFILEKNTNDTEIIVDEYSVKQIFSNLIDNAVKFTEYGRITTTIYKDDLNRLAVSISDTGTGISPKYMEDLFKPFTQEEQGYTRKYDGNGLGLAVAKKFAELNNAEIEVYSEKNMGSTFTVIFKNNFHT